MKIASLFANTVLIATLIAWGAAQILKVPWQYFRTRQWDWTLLLRAGGMPSSHSALVSAAAHSIGLHQGFDSPLFALAVTIAMIVIYDATGVRRQAGKHAERINAIVRDLARGHFNLMKHDAQTQLMEVLGHTPLEALAGTLLGVVFAQVCWLVCTCSH